MGFPAEVEKFLASTKVRRGKRTVLRFVPGWRSFEDDGQTVYVRHATRGGELHARYVDGRIVYTAVGLEYTFV